MINTGEILAEGACWKFFSLLFQCPSYVSAIAAKVILSELPPGERSDAEPVVKLLQDYQEVATVYHSFLGSAGIISPYESDYQARGEEGMREKGAILGDIAGFYKAFGFEHAREILETPDHVAVECAFMSFLKLKEGYMVTTRNDAAYRICVEAEAKFLNEHFLVWMPEFLDRASRNASHDFYASSVRLLQRFLAKGRRDNVP